MKALVLERVGELSLRDIEISQEMGPDDVRIRLHTVGVCGSDVHYYTHGRIGDFVVNAPMVLGHEAAGTVIETGANVTHLKVGDRVCMEPGIPDPKSRASRLGLYNVDPAVTFWATPPVHGVLCPETVHPASFTYRLPDNVSFAEGAMVEPFAVGMQAAARANITPGDTAVVTGCGTIGIMVALAALAGGCSRVLISDISATKLKLAESYGGITGVNLKEVDLVQTVNEATQRWGADIVFECSGAPAAVRDLFKIVRPGGTVVIVGLPPEPVAVDLSAACFRECRIETVFRYANVFDRALALIAAGKVDLKPLVSSTYAFDQSIAAFERAAEGRPEDVKLQIVVNGETH
ncbi:NAD(P)-dependent alcohol dehydrogenase (plasmid) [Agrobacterium salinitolerans]|uniref:NAD(P)-dependent alcohol dehydrogenase n=1 Tax=Agrobacterium salinitolerans TaxID=1183413 RepID=UPI001C227FCB|nr:NAD(P)-dependent alcohol dehydrogenase [Agrobacterium salinitolerans]QXC52807.1 NAD(P)-dependent alcohol dehydrogenase [Agrobacterium salinitolerans]